MSPSKVSLPKGNYVPLGTYLMTFTSQIYSYILLPTICKIISSLSAVMDEEKYFFLTKNRYHLSVVLLGHRFELGGIRFPLIFFNSNTWYWDEKKAKLANFIELAILELDVPRGHIIPILQECPSDCFQAVTKLSHVMSQDILS